MAKETEKKDQVEELTSGEAAAMAEDVSDGLYRHTFSKPVFYEGRQIDAVTFDFDSLTGRDIRNISREMKAEGTTILVKSLDDDFLARYAALAIQEEDIDVGLFDAMPGKDFNKIVSVARRFL